MTPGSPSAKHPIASRPDILLLLGGLSALTAFATDIILPSTGLIAGALGVPENRGALLIGTYFIGYGLGQFIWGLLSDAYGRRPVLIIGLSGFVIASVACVLSTSFTMLVTLRFIQGLSGGSPVVARAIVRDIGQGAEAARLMSILMSVVALAPLVAPSVGSGLLVLFSWHSAFIVLAAVGAMLLVLVIGSLPETLKNPRKERLRPAFILAAVPYLFSKRDFLVGTSTTAFSFAGFASVLSMGAVVTERAYGIGPKEFGAVFAVGAVFLVTGILGTRAVLRYLGLRRTGVVSMGILGVAVALHGTFLAYTPGFPVFWGTVGVYMMAMGMIFPTGSAVALEPAGDMPGFASSIVGMVQMLAGAAGAGVASALFDGSHRAISITMVVCGGLAILCFAGVRLSDSGKARGG
ncbi:MAG: multidrug effflux MFS transporter [Paracoccaceae bacterium]